MSATQTRLPIERAREIAWEVCALLGPWCERIEIAGSARRQRPTCGDVELVCIPRYGEASRDLFQEVVEPGVNLLDLACDRLFVEGAFGKRYDKNGRPRWGSGLKWATYRDVALDLFPVISPAQWGVDFLIRTGSAAFSKRLVTPVEQGGWCPKGLYFKDGQLWRIGYQGPAEPLDTPSEMHVFLAVGRGFIPPEDREVP